MFAAGGKWPYLLSQANSLTLMSSQSSPGSIARHLRKLIELCEMLIPMDLTPRHDAIEPYSTD